MADPDDSSRETATERVSLNEISLGRRLREANAEELARLLSEHLDEMSPDDAIQALRNSFVTGQQVRTLAQTTRLTAHYDVRRDLTMHGKTPEVFSQRFVSGLRWRDLARASSSVQVRPLVRRQAEKALSNRLPGLTLGEKISLGRIASTGVLHQLKHDNNPRVIEALLENPRLTEGILGPMLNNAATPPTTLQVIARHRRWANRYQVRLSLVRNPNTPLQLAVQQVSALKKTDQRALAKDRRLRAPIRDRARLHIGI